ncbi:MAG: alginate export family protein, partial [Deltaproteobacteria bacterium]|nr:alginate export family protein [Deltaproteobacteria bacterium]
RWNKDYDTRVNTVGGRAAFKASKLHAGLDLVGNLGTTKEVAAAYSLITNDPVLPQKIAQIGGRAVVRWDEPRFTGYLEVDYASGDADPQAGTPLSQFRFAEDTNVGLLMFEHAVHFQSARASAAAVEITRRLGADTFPAERINTRGAFTDAFAIFPQVDVRPTERLLLRGGVLVAWAPAPVVDPVQSLSRRDGQQIADDLVNFVGGKPGSFYGVELDARAQWRFLDHFAIDLEAALLFPGDALQDVNGRAENSFLAQGRTTAFF